MPEDPTAAQTQVEDAEALPEGVASAPPPILSFIVWIGVFSAVTWGFMVLFRLGRRGED